MFFIKRIKKRRKIKNIITALEKTFLIKKNVKIFKKKVDLFFPENNLIVEFINNINDINQERNEEIDDNDFEIINLCNDENVFSSISKILYVLLKKNK